ncbi:MAG: amidase [Gammaproteobacteria bacterium]|nr:amidase [Gammaproteobacteria bacterium]
MGTLLVDESIHWMSAGAIAEAVRSRKVSPVEVVEAVLSRIDSVNGRLNAVVTLCTEEALATAHKAEQLVMGHHPIGSLHGVPFTVKDSTDTAQVRTTMGSRLMSAHVPETDAVLVQRLKAAGAILVGKTNLPEFAGKAVTDNLLFGPTRNPWGLDLTPGGSSGGAAAAVAAGMGPLATGNDAGGSIRIPASCCGVVGFKPQFGRVPSYPYFDQWESLSHEGPITRTVEDCALMLDAMIGTHWGDRHSLPNPGFHFAARLPTFRSEASVVASLDLGYARISRDVETAFRRAVDAMRSLGAQVTESEPKLGPFDDILFTLINAELAAMLAGFEDSDRQAENLHPLLQARLEAAKSISTRQYVQAGFERRRLSSRFGQFFEPYDLLMTPTLGTSAWRLDATGGYLSEIDGQAVQGLQWSLCHLFNLTGHPAISIPWDLSPEGLPIGIQIVGQPHGDLAVLQAAAALESVRPIRYFRPNL